MTDFEPALRRHLERGFRRYSFGFCEGADWEALRRFLREHWSADHPYVSCGRLVRWMFLDAETGRYSFYLARHRETGEIHACAAFVMTSQFDRSLPVRDIWPGLWRSVPGSAAGLGAECLRRLMEAVRPRSIGGVGMSRHTVDILPKLGWTIGVMDHHYLLNPDVREFRLVEGAPAAAAAVPRAGAAHRRLRDLDAAGAEALRIDGFDPLSCVPAKTGVYLANRYARHPVYTYRLMAVEDGGGPLGVLVARTVEAGGARAVRLVDFVGRDEAWEGLGPALVDLVRREGAEYADLYSFGLDPGRLRAAGMIPHPPDDPVVVPNYFEPFERRNKVLDCGWIVPPGARYRVFKGDSDQDRPARIPPDLRDAE
ncbi:MAG: hypothetical protein FJ221_14450 [Lentisphaerae bacterium]|nr:hypothetical protein [Lentisphaerota bacterium]